MSDLWPEKKLITIYKTQHCPYCVMVQKLCDRYKVKYKVVDLTYEDRLRHEISTKANAMTVPITTDGVTYIAGWQPKALIELLKS